MGSTKEVEDIHLINAKTNCYKRILCCAVNERLVCSEYVQSNGTKIVHFVPTSDTKYQGQFWTEAKQEPNTTNEKPNKNDMLKSTYGEHTTLNWIAFLHPEDLGSTLFYSESNHTRFLDETEAKSVIVIEPEFVLDKILKWNSVSSDVILRIRFDIENSTQNQAIAYRNWPTLRSIGDSYIAWEQSLVEGHPTHPTNKIRLSIPPLLPISPGANLYNPIVYFYSLPRQQISVAGDYMSILEKILPKGTYNPDTEMCIPVHELQVPGVESIYPMAKKLDFFVQAQATSSIRTVVFNRHPEWNIKLSLAVRLTSLVRTITRARSLAGVLLKDILPTIVKGNDSLLVARDVGSAIVIDENDENSKHFSCIIREDPEYVCKQYCKEEAVVVVAALTEKLSNGNYVVVEAFELDSKNKRLQFFRNYAVHLVSAFLPPLLKFGVGFEAHGQNTLVRLGRSNISNDWNVVGFVIRDVEGGFIKKCKFESSTGLFLQDFPFESDANVNALFHHTVVQLNLQSMIRSLDLHYNGEGWKIVRDILGNALPTQSSLRMYMLESPYVSFKSYFTMMFKSIEEYYYNNKIANLVLFEGTP